MNPSINQTLKLCEKILKKDQKFIISADLDGILSALVLQKYLNWQIVGFCDSKNTVWILPKEKKNFKEIVFIDIFIRNPEIKCIDQHIVCLDHNQSAEMYNSQTKLNPNIQNIRYAKKKHGKGEDDREFKWKYPLGTVHYIMACIEALKIDIKIENKQSQFNNIKVFDLLLRADDAAFSTSRKYRKNCEIWWNWLKELGGNFTTTLADYCLNFKEDEAKNIQDVLKDEFKDLKCKPRTKDANFSNQLVENKGEIKYETLKLIEKISSSLDFPKLKLESYYEPLVGKYETAETYNEDKIEKVFNRKDLFSYAFTFFYGHMSMRGFSYTLFPPDGIPPLDN